MVFTSLPPASLHQSLEMQRSGFSTILPLAATHPPSSLLRPPTSPHGSIGGPSSFPHSYPCSEASMWGLSSGMPAGWPAPPQVYPSIQGGSLWGSAERSHSGPQPGELLSSAVAAEEWGDGPPSSPFARPGSTPGEPPIDCAIASVRRTGGLSHPGQGALEAAGN